MASKKAKPAETARQETSSKPSAVDRAMPATVDLAILIAVLVLAIRVGVFFVMQALARNGYHGFPLDDPWIHLTFARNIVAYGSFSYFKNEMVTSGSTSPLYTLLLALLYFINKNEFIISYILGIGFFALSIFFFYKIAGLYFNRGTVAAAIVLLALQPRLNLIAVSGMETTMFIFFITGSFYFYMTARQIPLGIFLGLSLWCRPDGVVLWLALLIDYFVMQPFYCKNKEEGKSKPLNTRSFCRALAIGLGIVILYGLFNYALSGSIVPNTYKAKLGYYQYNPRANFLKHEVLEYFSTAEFAVVWPLFLIGLWQIAVHFVKRKREHYSALVLFLFGLIAVYTIKLPFAHRFGRYVMPLIPFYLLVAIYGLKTITEILGQKTKSALVGNLIFYAWFGLAMALSLANLAANADAFSASCRYHHERHVAVGKWIEQNTRQDAIIAAHDIGAIGFYGQRKLIDMVGLVTPEFVAHLHEDNYPAYLTAYLEKNGATHLAVLKNWLEIANDNPIYVPIRQFEVMELYRFKPGQSHFTPRAVSAINAQAIRLLQKRDFSAAESALRQSLRVDPLSSRTVYLLGVVNEMTQNSIQAERYYQQAAQIFPEYREALMGLARLNYRSGKLEEAKKHLQHCLRIDGNFAPAAELLAKVESLSKK